ADVNRADIRGLTFLGSLLYILKYENYLYPWLFFDKVIRLFNVLMKYGANPCLPYYGVRKYEVPGVCRSETSFIELIPLYEIMTLNNRYGAPFRNVVDRYVTEERIDFLKSQESIAPEELFSDKFHVASPKDLKEVTFPSQSDAVLDQKKCVLAVYGIRPLVDARKFDAALKLLAKTLDMDPTASFLPHNNQYFVSLLFGELNRTPYDAEERRKNYLDFIELLIANADVNRVDALGATMLIEAVACREPEICRMLIQRGANVNYDTRSYNISCERRYPLFDATLTFCLDREFDAKWRECVSILIQSGAVVETSNEDATTHDGEPLYNITEGKPYQPVKFSKKTIKDLVAVYESLGVPKESLFSKKV
ncbi:MAG: hypothetical protein IK077_08525, partial [Thermoguttaceae bacterium]|nr:hypothetical protein [Thermoguttaceae bacterium]